MISIASKVDLKHGYHAYVNDYKHKYRYRYEYIYICVCDGDGKYIDYTYYHTQIYYIIYI